MGDIKIETESFYNQIRNLLDQARGKVFQQVNKTMVLTYFEIGKLIVEKEQGGNMRATYGKQILKELSKRLISEFGKGFSLRNLEQMRQFYFIYSKTQTASAEFILSWSHYLILMRIEDEDERKFYEKEAANNNWSLKELQRQYNSALYTRLTLSRDKSGVKKLSGNGLVLEKPQDAIKDPYILEFIGLPEFASYSESDLEQQLISKLEHFLLELGTGFTFVAR